MNPSVDDHPRSQTSRAVGRRLSATRRGPVWGLVVALMVMTVAWGASTYQQGLVDDTARKALAVRGDAIESAAGVEVARYLGIATVVADGLGAMSDITEDKFRDLTADVDDMGLDGAPAIVFIGPPVATEDVVSAQREWRKSFGSELALQPVGTRDEHIFTLASMGLDGSDRVGGLDVSAAEAPYAALKEAQTTGRPTVSDAYQLIIDQQLPRDERQTSFVLVVPVVKDDVFLGWVLLGLRGQDFLGHVLDVAGSGTVETVLEAADVDDSDTVVASVLHDHDGRTFGETRVLQVAQQAWTLQLSADMPSLVGPSRFMPRNTRIAGVIAGLLAGSLVWVLVTGRARSAQRVRSATAELAAAEAVAREQALMLDAMVETIEEVGVMVVDSEGTFLLQSQAARRILGIGEHDGPVADPDKPEDWQRNFGIFHLDGSAMELDEMPLVRALHGETITSMPMVIRNDVRTEGAHIEVSGRPLALGDGGHGALAVFRDVTQERIQQAELAGFAGVVAHDLRHPLTVIGGYAGMIADHCLPALEGDPALLAETAAYLAKVTAGTARMNELISDLLGYTTARDAEMTWRDVDLKALGNEVATTYIDGDPDRAVPHIHLGDLPVVEGDPERLRQLFNNLIGNAIKYVAPGSVPLLDVSAVEHRGRVRLRFADRGIGISSDKINDVFRPFVRAHAGNAAGVSYAGTGLGLAICHQVVQRHGGDISVIQNPGGGSVFVVDLPYLRPLGARGAADPAAGDSTPVPDPELARA